MIIPGTLKGVICRKIKILRKQHGFSQVETATLLNMSQNTYSQLEAGKTKMDIERLQDIARLYKISLEDILAPPSS